MAEEVEVEEVEEEGRVVNATAAANQATLRAHAPSLQMAAEEDIVEVVDMEAEVEVEGTVADLVEERLGMQEHLTLLGKRIFKRRSAAILAVA